MSVTAVSLNTVFPTALNDCEKNELAKCPVKLFALQKHQIHLSIAIMSTYSIVFWLSLYNNSNIPFSVRPREVRTVFTDICFLGPDEEFCLIFFGRSRDAVFEDLQKKLVSIEIFQLRKFRYWNKTELVLWHSFWTV